MKVLYLALLVLFALLALLIGIVCHRRYSSKSTEIPAISKMSKAEVRRWRKKLPISYYFNDSEDMRELRELTFKTMRLLERHRITHFALFGTLIGALRHGAIIPWDDDIDFGILQGETDKLMSLKEEFAKEGLKLSEINTRTLTRYNVEYLDSSKDYWVDLFPYSLRKDGKWHRVKGLYKPMADKDLFPLKMVKFYDSMIPIPKNGSRITAQYYGNDWKTHGLVSMYYKETGKHKHLTNKKYQHKVRLNLKEISKSMKQLGLF